MHITSYSLIPALLALSTTLVSAQDAYGQAQCVTSILQTSTACCGTLAGSTTTSFIDCHGCAPTSEPEIQCRCLVAPPIDENLISTAIACKPTATPSFTTKVVLPTAVAAYCEGRPFPAIYPPTAAQRCCEGELSACNGIVPGYTSIPVPSQCSYTTCEPDSQCSRCCAGDLRACDGVFPPPSDEPLPSGVPAWCEGLMFTLQDPPTQKQECCSGKLEKCEGLTESSEDNPGSDGATTGDGGIPTPTASSLAGYGGPAVTDAVKPCTTTVTRTIPPCGDCGHTYDTTATISLACNGCVLKTKTVRPKGAGICMCPTDTQTSVFACATA